MKTKVILRWLVTSELFRTTFCHYKSPYTEHKSIILYALFTIEILIKPDKKLCCAIKI